MVATDFTIEHLKQLPLRAIVALAARCARRVEHLAELPEGDPQREHREEVIEAALRFAEDFAKGSDAAPGPSVVAAIDEIAIARRGPLGNRSAAAAAADAAHAALSALSALGTRKAQQYRPLLEGTEGDRTPIGSIEKTAEDIVPLDAFTAAMQACYAAGSGDGELVTAGLKDYERLLGLGLGRYPEPGEPVDPSPAGPLGPL